MKIIASILTLYMFALALVPCGDSGGGLVELIKHHFDIEHQTHHAEHQQHSKDCGDDNCPPFCICSCCSSTLNYPVKLSLQITPPLLAERVISTFVPDINSFSPYSSVWHPPRFS